MISTEFYNQDSLFSVSIPHGYAILDKTSSLLSFENADNGGIISIKKEGIIPSTYFTNIAEHQMKAGQDKGFTIAQVSKSDTSLLFKISKGLFRTEEIFYLKQGELNNYIIDVSAPDASKIGPQIYHSLKEHNPLEFSGSYTIENAQYIYEQDGFKIDSSYQLVVNTEYIQEYDLHANKHKLIGAYCCVQNPDDVQNMIVININIIDYSTEIQGNTTKQKLLDDYKSTLNRKGYENNFNPFQGISALEYSYKQDFGDVKVPVKAIFLFHRQKSYLFSVMSLSNTDIEFNKLRNSVYLL